MKEERQTSEKRPHLLRNILLALLVVCLIAAAAFLAYRFREELFGGKRAEAYQDIEPLTYETGSRQMFTLAGDGLAVASSTGLQLMDRDGYTIARSVFSMETPAVSGCDNGSAVFFDVGGTAVRAVNAKGEITVLDGAQKVITARMGQGGALAVCTEETGYKGLVTVYNAAFTPIYRWYSGSGWLLNAVTGPSDRMLAALCAEESGTVLHLFDLSSEEEAASLRCDGELYFDLFWLSGGTLCLVGENGLEFLDSEGMRFASYGFGGDYLQGYACSGGQLTVFTGRYLTGGSGTVKTINASGEVLGSVRIGGPLISLCRSGRQTLVLSGDGLALYSETMELIASDPDALGVRSALLRSDGTALLLSAYSGEVRRLE